ARPSTAWSPCASAAGWAAPVCSRSTRPPTRAIAVTAAGAIRPPSRVSALPPRPWIEGVPFPRRLGHRPDQAVEDEAGLVLDGLGGALLGVDRNRHPKAVRMVRREDPEGH